MCMGDDACKFMGTGCRHGKVALTISMALIGRPSDIKHLVTAK